MKANLATAISKICFVLLLTLPFLGCIGPAQKLTPVDTSITRTDANSIVVVHSRSGNTAQMGLLISGKMNSDYIRLDGPAGSQDSFVSAPRRNQNVEMSPQTIDLSKYQLVFLGSPIWFGYPTAFIYSFIKNNNLTSKKVVLFYTYGGRLTKEAIAEWKGIVQQHGATVIDVIGINRSVFETSELLQSEANKMIDQHKSIWMGDKN